MSALELAHLGESSTHPEGGRPSRVNRLNLDLGHLQPSRVRSWRRPRLVRSRQARLHSCTGTRALLLTGKVRALVLEDIVGTVLQETSGRVSDQGKTETSP